MEVRGLGHLICNCPGQATLEPLKAIPLPPAPYSNTLNTATLVRYTTNFLWCSWRPVGWTTSHLWRVLWQTNFLHCQGSKSQIPWSIVCPRKSRCQCNVVLSNSTLWVTGGYDHSDQSWNLIKATEYITKDGQTSQDPDLPLTLQ